MTGVMSLLPTKVKLRIPYEPKAVASPEGRKTPRKAEIIIKTSWRSHKSRFYSTHEFDLNPLNRTYVDSMGYNGTSTLYANSSGPRICTIRPTAAWSTPAVSLTLDSSRLMRCFSRGTLPVDDVCSGTRMLG